MPKGLSFLVRGSTFVHPILHAVYVESSWYMRAGLWMDGLTSFQNSRLCYGPIYGLRQREAPDKMEFAVGKQSQAGSSHSMLGC